ncbi:blast:Zinc finger protein 420 [Drosophila guanche]|uniref:Blast:Zinc finger protein 420 n=1 Tax=Drosophila guanche TaxID=7266 RepID=A0A3B0KGX0_DROGU|nr:blast:Zinc finger protein 420 [Drosophila guanche]
MRKKICRICSGAEATIYLFCSKNGHFIRQILSITGVGLNEKEGISSYMCDKCVFDLDCAIKFRQRCIISEKRNLEKANSTGSIEEEDTDTDSEIESYGLNTDEENTDDYALEYESEICTQNVEQANTKRRGKYAEPYICDDCGKSINSWSNFQEHKLRHTGVKNFALIAANVSPLARSWCATIDATREKSPSSASTARVDFPMQAPARSITDATGTKSASSVKPAERVSLALAA